MKHHRSLSTRPTKDDLAVPTAAICGNPNSGKTTIFNAITGLNQKVGNYPGVTVEKITGFFHTGPGADTRVRLVDVPGTYSLSAFSPDEYIAASALYGGISCESTPDVLVCVVDATNMERGLYLFQQIQQVGCPVILALNMIDVARRRGLDIDTEKLSELIGAPVVGVVGSRRQGIEKLKQTVAKVLARPAPPPPPEFDATVEGLVERLMGLDNGRRRTRAEYLRVIYDIDGPAQEQYLREHESTGGLDDQLARLLTEGRDQIRARFGSLTGGETMPLTERASQISQQVVKASRAGQPTRSERADKILLHPIAGPVILLLLMSFVFQAIFSFAEPFMDFIDTAFSWLAFQVEGSMAEGPVRSLLTDGVIGGVGSVVIFLPQIVILFLFIALLEDSGYMARAAFLVDRLFRWCGLSGKAFVPMLSSFACAIPGIMATRTIEDRKLRFITIMVAPLMTCSARLPVYAIMIAAFIPYQTYLGLFNLQGLTLTALYLLGIVAAVVVSFVLQLTVFKTEAGTFIMEMPGYKVPTLRSVLVRVLHRARSFLARAGTVIFAITVIIWVLSYYPHSTDIDSRYRSEARALDQRAEPDGESVAGVTNTDELETARSELANRHAGEHIRNSYFGRLGRAIEPVFVPLGWDWRISMSVLASFPAREVIIATLGTIFNLGSDEGEESERLIDKMRRATWAEGPRAGERLFTVPVALSVMVFFALCCQCGATLATIRAETNQWRYAVFVFLYMTGLAYVASWATYQIAVRAV